MAYAIIIKNTLREENVSRNNKLREKLGRELLPEEVIYNTKIFTKYVSVLRPMFSDYEIRTTKDKKDAIFYIESELPIIKHRLKGATYFIIDTKTGEEIERIPAAINIALPEPETIGDVKLNA